MPQLDTSTFLSQIFWLVITFTALYWYLQRFILPKLGGIISRRALKAADDLEQANTLQKNISLLQQEIIKESHATNEKIATMHKEAIVRIHSIKQERLDKINADFIKKQKDITDEIAKTKEAALDQIQAFVIDYVILILAKITGEKPSGKELEQCYLKLEAKS